MSTNKQLFDELMKVKNVLITKDLYNNIDYLSTSLAVLCYLSGYEPTISLSNAMALAKEFVNNI